MEWQDLWEKWWPRREPSPGQGQEHEREHIPLTTRQRQLTGYLIVSAVIAAMLLQFTGNKRITPTLSSVPNSRDQLVVEPVTSRMSSWQRSFEEDIENGLAKMLSQIEGVGTVQVMVSVITGSRLEVARDINGDKTTTTETDKQGGQRHVVAERFNEKVVIVREGQGSADKPIVLSEYRPVIGGVLVVADGAKNPGIKLRIARAVATAVDIPAHRVMVVARKK
ncbi:MAG: hypothetical protein GX986_00490 [Firmicutes bacterium]|nr:hypothetical protein [Bacillota bacterium]